MPTSLNGLTNNELNIRWKEPLLTEALNHKSQAVVPRGIYRGFRLGTHVNPLTISVTTDSSGLHIAQYETEAGVIATAANGYTLQIRRDGGTFALDLTPLAGLTVVVAIYARYATNQTTTGEIRAYTSVEWAVPPAEQGELIVLGTVVVPAAGVIPAANITETGRTSAWTNRATEATPWNQVVRNGGFQDGDVIGGLGSAVPSVDMIPPWVAETAGAGVVGVNFDLRCTTAQGRAPYSSSFELVPVTGGTDHRFGLEQRLSTPCVEGTRVRVRFYYRAVQVPAAGGIQMFLAFTGDLGTVVGGFTVDLTLTPANLNIDREFDQIFAAPVNARKLALFGVEPGAGVLSYAAASVAFRMSDVNVWVESIEPNLLDSADERVSGTQLAEKIVFDEPTSSALARVALPMLDVEPVTGNLRLRRRDAYSTTPADGQDFSVPTGKMVTLRGFETASTGVFTYNPLPSRSVDVSLLDGVAGTNANGEGPVWVYTIAPETLSYWKSFTNFGRLVFPLNSYLRAGMVLQDVRAIFEPGIARAAPGDRMLIALYKAVPDWTVPGNNPVAPTLIGAAQPDNGTVNKQLISCNFGSETVVRNGAAYYVVVGAGVDAGVNFDYVHGLQLIFDDPGPRNE